MATTDASTQGSIASQASMTEIRIKILTGVGQPLSPLRGTTRIHSAGLSSRFSMP